jgi:hypothetical protein
MIMPLSPFSYNHRLSGRSQHHMKILTIGKIKPYFGEAEELPPPPLQL